VCCYGRGTIFLYISSATTRCLWLCGTAGCCDEFVSGYSLRSVRYDRACRAVTDVFKFVPSVTFSLWLAVSRPCVCIRMLCASKLISSLFAFVRIGCRGDKFLIAKME
jgi:hypothetical protein